MTRAFAEIADATSPLADAIAQAEQAKAERKRNRLECIAQYSLDSFMARATDDEIREVIAMLLRKCK